jgi:hypothetical protein
MKGLLVVALYLLMGTASAAQAPAGAEAAVQKYAHAMKAYDTAAITALMHPEALKQFRTAFNGALTGPKRDQAARQLLPLFSVTTVPAYMALSDAEAYKRLNDAIARGAPELIEMASKSTYEIVGSFVKDGVAHVTFNMKTTVEGRSVSMPVVQMAKMHNGTWLLMLPASADATIAGIEAEFK